MKKILKKSWKSQGILSEEPCGSRSLLTPVLCCAESDRSKERMMEILEDRGLSFMFPLLRVQSDLWKQIRNDPSPNNIYKWIKENVKEDLQNNPRFIIILISK